MFSFCKVFFFVRHHIYYGHPYYAVGGKYMINSEYNYTNSKKRGLSSEEAALRLERDGENRLAEEKPPRPFLIFVNQFKDIMMLILLAATVVSVLLGEWADAVTIILIVLLNAILGFIQEYRAEKALEALGRMTAPTARCMRDAKIISVPADELVTGDVIFLEAGDRVPADCAVTEQSGLYSDESILTGEVLPVEKTAVAGALPKDNSLGQNTVAYSGTIITRGHAEAEVIATGRGSQIGKISDMLSDIGPTETPLQKRLGELGKILAAICLVICIIVFIAGILRGEPIFDMLLTGISIAIAAIPEGLPATVTIALALAVSRMMKQNALVNKLHSVETLGCSTVICSDKTGTITENKMTVKRIFAAGEKYDVSGNGYKIAGAITHDGKSVNPSAHSALKELFVCASVCNNASISAKENITSRERGRLSAEGEWTVSGDPTEAALLVAAAKAGVNADGYTRTGELPFESESRSMTVFTRSQSGRDVTFIKGALDVILPRCSHIMTSGGALPLERAVKADILAVQDVFSGEALRVLAFAKKDGTDAEGGLTLLGLAGMLDPPREEAKQAIKTCKSAHIKTVMITGDHPNTAVAIAKQAGILRVSSKESVMTGEQLACTSDEELSRRIERIRVFARVSPSDKLRIVRAFKSRGHIVTMTGDGVNDAPAVKEAQIGVAMGQSGTDVTKQAADLILLDDNFATLVSAVEQGRTIYANIRKFVRYLLSCNIGEVITMFLGILMGMPPVLLPTQILLVNLVTDGLPAIALGAEPSDDGIMKRKPRKAEDSFFSGGLMQRIFFRGIMIGLCTLGCFTVALRMGNTDSARTCALFTLVMSQLLHVFECKSEEKNIFTVSYLNNPKLIGAALLSAGVIFAAMYIPVLREVFSTTALTLTELLISFGFAAAMPVLSCIGGVIFPSEKKE